MKANGKENLDHTCKTKASKGNPSPKDWHITFKLYKQFDCQFG